MKKYLLFFALIVTSYHAAAQANKEDVRVLLEVSGIINPYQNIVNQIEEQISEDKRAAFKKDMQGLLTRVRNKQIDDYSKVLTQDEVVRLTEFFKSSLGASFVKKKAQIDLNNMEQDEAINLELQGIIMKYMM